MNDNIPTEVYLAFLDRTIDIHWDYHAILMMGIWFILVPIGVVAVRFLKPKPTTYGIEKGTGKLDPKLIWWTIHYFSLYAAIGLSLAGMTVAMVVSGGFSGSMHSIWGFATILFGCLQIVSAWFRGSHGGKHGVDSDPDDPSTWHGDHFDMTPQRRRFEAYHKTAGYFTIMLALGAVISGLIHYWMPVIAIALGFIFVGLLVLFVLLESKGYRQDTYRSVYGNHPDNPYNKAREGL
ncbi:MAG: cytochrome b561 domain-containing protein [Candidatus Neomarinimicrobiota bacterium]